MSYFQKHKYHLLAFFVLILIAGVSGYQNFKIQNTWNTEQHTNKDVNQSFSAEWTDPSSGGSFDDEAEGYNLNTTQTPKHTNIATEKQATITSTESEISALDGSASGGINLKSEILNPITLKVAGEEYITELEAGMTTYELMQTLTAMSAKPFMFSGQDYGAGMGYFVTEINGVKNDPQAGKYWIYYVNSESAKVGISNYIINKGDVIEWKYENNF